MQDRECLFNRKHGSWTLPCCSRNLLQREGAKLHCIILLLDKDLPPPYTAVR